MEIQKIKVETEVTKETYELGQGIDNFIGALQTALKDGWQVGQDLPVVLTAAIGHLVPAMQGAEQIGAETKDVQAFANGVYLGLGQTAFRFVKKAE